MTNQFDEEAKYRVLERLNYREHIDSEIEALKKVKNESLAKTYADLRAVIAEVLIEGTSKETVIQYVTEYVESWSD